MNRKRTTPIIFHEPSLAGGDRLSGASESQAKVRGQTCDNDISDLSLAKTMLDLDPSMCTVLKRSVLIEHRYRVSKYRD